MITWNYLYLWQCSSMILERGITWIIYQQYTSYMPLATCLGENNDHVISRKCSMDSVTKNILKTIRSLQISSIWDASDITGQLLLVKADQLIHMPISSSLSSKDSKAIQFVCLHDITVHTVTFHLPFFFYLIWTLYIVVGCLLWQHCGFSLRVSHSTTAFPRGCHLPWWRSLLLPTPST